MIGKGVGARQGTHAGSMGEAFGDFDALAASTRCTCRSRRLRPLHRGRLRDRQRLQRHPRLPRGPTDGRRVPRPEAKPRHRSAELRRLRGRHRGTEVHADGEIWVAVQIDLRELFLPRNPSRGQAKDIACAHGQHDTNACPGDRRWIQDYYDAMVIMPRNPTMIQARDAMLAADPARFGGANRDLLWQGFAMRGFGQNQQHASATGTPNPVPAFRRRVATTTARSTSSSIRRRRAARCPVNAKIYVGDYAARATQIADTNRPRSTPGRMPPATSTTPRRSCPTAPARSGRTGSTVGATTSPRWHPATGSSASA